MLLAQDARPQLTETKAAERLGLKPGTLKRMRNLGRGPAFFKVSRAVRYDPTDIDAYLGRRRVVPANEERA
ncbi:helix-turn-helix domain-containing protein [Bosea sp. F3-2]|nr:helix-turn-helix domain-containing protein [Bosea sp. F3-2]